MKLVTYHNHTEGYNDPIAHIVFGKMFQFGSIHSGYHCSFTTGVQKVRTVICPVTFKLITVPTIKRYSLWVRRFRNQGRLRFLPVVHIIPA